MIKRKMRWFILFWLFVVSLVSYMDRANLSVAAPHVMEEFKLTATEIGLVFSALTIGYTALNFMGGFLADRFSARVIISACLVSWSLLTIGTGLVWSFTSLVVVRLLFGAAEGPLLPSNTKIVSNWMLREERGVAQGLWLAALPLGTVVGAPLSGYIVEEWGWRSVFYMFGVGGLLLGVLTYMVLRDQSSEHPWVDPQERALLEKQISVTRDRETFPGEKNEGYSSVFLNPTTWVLSATYFCMAALFWANLGWLPTYFVKARNASILSSGIYYAIPNICAALGGILAGRLSDHWFGNRRGPLLVLSFLLIIPALVVAVNTSSVYISLGAFSIAAAANYACITLMWALPLDLYPKEQVAAGSGIMLTFGSISGALAPILMGFILDQTNSFNMSYYTFAALSLIGAALAAWIVRREKTADVVVFSAEA